MKITILDDNKYFTTDQKRTIRSNVQNMLKLMDQKNNSQLCISFVDDDIIRELNTNYRDIKRATDVLSFPQDGPDYSILGDIVISVDTARRHAVRYQNSFEYEIKKLIIHGILHLLGYDHKKKKEAEVMRAKESELLAQIESEN